MLANNTMYVSLPVQDLDVAKEFYSKTLGLQIIDQNETGIWYQAGTGRMALYQSDYAGTNKGTAAIWEVDDPKSTVKALEARGVQFEKYDIPNVRRRGAVHHYRTYDAAWFKDPSGNLVCITHHM
jgi:catechol-2,3-dioxygenase